MSQTFQAIVENGVLKPLAKVYMREGTRVTVTISVDADVSETPAPPRDDREDWPEWLRAHGPMSDDDTRLVSEAIEEAFERIDPNAWR